MKIVLELDSFEAKLLLEVLKRTDPYGMYVMSVINKIAIAAKTAKESEAKDGNEK